METFLYNRIQRYVFPYIDSNMYILTEGHEALIIDPHKSEEAALYLKRNQVSKVTILLTHEHFDHICGLSWFCENYNAQVICQREALDMKRQKNFNRPLVIALILSERGEDEKIEKLEAEYSDVCPFTAEVVYNDSLDLSWQGHNLHMEHVPGHSPASSLIVLDGICVFTGDSLIPNEETIVRWPWSDAKTYREKVLPRLRKIPDQCIIYPGHRAPVKMADLVFENGIFFLTDTGGR